MTHFEQFIRLVEAGDSTKARLRACQPSQTRSTAYLSNFSVCRDIVNGIHVRLKLPQGQPERPQHRQ